MVQRYENTGKTNSSVFGIEGLPTNEGLLQIKSDIYSGMQIYNRTREYYALREKISLLHTDNVPRNEFMDIVFKGMLDDEIKTYQKTVPSQELFYHFKQRTLSTLRQKKSLSAEEKRVLETLSNDRIHTFYDFAVATKMIEPIKSAQQVQEAYDKIAVQKVNLLNKTRMETALAMNYYMDSLGIKYLPQLKFQGYDIFKKHLPQLAMRYQGDDVVRLKKELSGTTEANNYLLTLMRRSPRWASICEFQKETALTTVEQGAWINLTPPTKKLPRALTSVLDAKKASCERDGNNELAESITNYSNQIQAAYDSFVQAQGAFKAINGYTEAYKTLTKNSGRKIPYFDMDDARYVDSFYQDDVSQERLTNQGTAVFEGVQNSNDDVDAGVDAGIIGATWTLGASWATKGAAVGTAVGGPVGGVVGGATGFVGAVAAGFVADYLIKEAIKPVTDNVKKGRMDSVVSHCNMVQKSADLEVAELKKIMDKLKKYPKLKEALSFAKEHTDAYDAYLERELENSDDNTLFDKTAAKKDIQEKLLSGEDKETLELINQSKLKQSFDNLTDTYLNIEELRQEIAIYSKCIQMYQKSQTQTQDKTLLEQMIRLKSREADPNLSVKSEVKSQKTEPDLSAESALKDKTTQIHPDKNHPFNYFTKKSNSQKRFGVSSSYKSQLVASLIGSEYSGDGGVVSIFGEMEFGDFQEKELAILKQKDPSKLTYVEKKKLQALENGEVTSFNTYYDKVFGKRYNGTDLFRATFMYAQSESALTLPEGFENLFNQDRAGVIQQAKSLGLSDEQIASQFMAEASCCDEINKGLRSALDFKDICRKKGWVNQNGEPDLNKIAPLPEKDMLKTLKDVKQYAEVAEKQTTELLKAFSTHRMGPVLQEELKKTHPDENVIRNAIENGADVNQVFDVSIGDTLLHEAVNLGRTDIVEALLESGSLDLMKQNKGGYTAIEVAMYYRDNPENEGDTERYGKIVELLKEVEESRNLQEKEITTNVNDELATSRSDAVRTLRGCASLVGETTTQVQRAGQTRG